MRGPGGRDCHLEGRVLGGVLENVVSLVHLGEGERVGAHLLRRDAAAGHHLQQGRDGHRSRRAIGSRSPMSFSAIRDNARESGPAAERRSRGCLGEMPRKGRPYFGRPLTVESLSELCSVLANAAYGRRDLAIARDTDSTR